MPKFVTVATDFVEEARKLYSIACKDAGENKVFTDAVARLVGPYSDDYDALADRFKIEGEIMLQASALARKASRPHTVPKGHCDRCGADGVAVRPLGMGLHSCISCDVLGL